MRQVEAVNLLILFFMDTKFRIALCTRHPQKGALESADTFPN